ncbi:MAG: enoyl-CoA hydratase/isomerase family protein [Phenylobacterium sp.]|uniref:enoyl-CoA hydratase/isomerase family protein n=2 Tax=Phenylobacterium sp. TaxID=1871053 RepID=UPI0025DEE7D7|nr:enoyl-CoA hydratase-related protein [Phenylobacterium sp.]MCA6224703.1 enoyl-CoA hydratase/isomerase family protein [Phenylobacterium sp.]MCA6231445.1 enoyl-CoA hydratase/isomerase family protein [Phenylobacterium sp.]MCA6233712.1 enoyl-CoA hydratase/isomerase family protein [Phenylobacterium sp.]MCA6249526.1 enoyl-CoA hydratase/isomerase family protein [Phenylobacterium sp.]MCA6252661.1 enoyl-CoA hydratase/isomerase family protein [Phenylobacterium sp.]
MTYEHLDVRIEDEVAWATMNRPDRLNALNPRLVEELRDFFVGLYWRRDVRVVILRGAGRAFCAGLDLKERSGGNADRSVGAGLTGQRRISEIVIAMRRCPQPIIACIDGAASGGGFALALASDVRIATPTLKMNAAFIRIGLSACDIGVSYFLPRMVGSSVAAEYMLTGRFMGADRALQLGLISRIVDPGALEAEARDFAADMLHATPLGLRLTKEALNYAIDAQGLEAAIAMEDRNQILCAQDGDFAEGVRAFLEKRKPVYAVRES